MMIRALTALLCLMLVSLALPSLAQDDAQEPAEDESYLTAAPEDMAWWLDAQFGLFVHWGPVSLRGTEIGWSRGGERRGTGGAGEIPVEEYDNLYKEFDPTDFDADQWVAMAQDAGMKYVVFTTKHHDGFCMFDTQLSDHKITNSPFGRDIVKELADACHRAGLKLGFYYSPPDWRHPDYRTDNHPDYIKYLHGQLRELCTDYGQVDIIWFDGLGGNADDWDSRTLFKMIRELQPHVIINNRAGLPADHDTPEQTIGRYQIDRPWESCITICNQWAWKPDDAMKSLKQCIETLVRCAGGDGNLLFNVGPMPTGAIEDRQIERLQEMGAWLRENGETIYATRGGPFKPGPWGAATSTGSTVYLHLLEPETTTVTLPSMEASILSARLLDGDGVVEVAQTDEQIEISVPGDALQEIDTIVVLELDRPAAEAEVGQLRSGSVAYGKTAVASNTFQNMAQYSPEAALDDDSDTRWATDAGVHEATFDIDLGEELTLGSAHISEAYDRVHSFELQVKEGDAWRTIYVGEGIGEAGVFEFDPVAAQHVRLSILQASDGPTIWEVQLFPPPVEE